MAGRIGTWFFFAGIMLIVLFSVYGEGMTSGLAGPPQPSSGHRNEMIGAAVLLLLSLIPLVGPGATKGLRVFGVMWAVIGGSLVLGMW